MSVESIITENLDIWTSGVKTKSASGRGSSNKLELYGINKLRELILDLAFKGKLVAQDCNDEPADLLLTRIDEERQRLVLNKKMRKPKALPNIKATDKPFELPEGWSWSFLGTVCKKLTDGSHNPPSDSGSGYPMLSSQNINFGRIDFSNPSRFVNEENFQKEHLRTQAKPNDVLLNIVASIGRSAVVPENAPAFVLQRSVAVLDSQLDSHFLSRQLVSPLCLDYYNKNAKGTAQKGIYLGKLSEMLIVVPPIKEQVRIVRKIDELMALCDQLESQTEASIEAHQTLVKSLLETLTNAKDADELNESWRRISAHFDVLFTTEDSIDQLKQTILQLAVMGKLVKQDPNDEPASKLLERIAAEKEQLIKDKKIKKQKPLPAITDDEKLFDLPNGWAFARVGNLCSKLGSGSTPRGGKNAYVEDGIPFLRSQNVWNDGLKLSDIAFIDDKTHQKMVNTKVFPGDVLLNITGASLGRSTILPSSIDEANVSQHVTIIRLVEPTMNQWIHLGILSPMIQSFVWGRQVGMAIEGLSKRTFELFEFPIPPLKEQQRIIAKVDQLMNLCELIKSGFRDSSSIKIQLADCVADLEIEAIGE